MVRYDSLFTFLLEEIRFGVREEQRHYLMSVSHSSLFV
jgi:hypothetical protein